MYPQGPKFKTTLCFCDTKYNTSSMILINKTDIFKVPTYIIIFKNVLRLRPFGDSGLSPREIEIKEFS